MDNDKGCLAPIGGALPKTKPLTPVQRRRLESAVAIADDPPEGITFQHTVLCQTCLPYRDQGDSTRVWERRQGAVFLRVEAGALLDRTRQRFVEVGLPYGSRPRLILAHLNREALLRGSPRIEIESTLTAFIRRIVPGRSPNARETNEFRSHLSRFAAAMVRMAVELPDDRAYQVDVKIIDAFELWLGKDERQRVLWPAEVELSPRYYASLTKHAVPLDERAIGALANSPMALDVYAWLAQRLHRIEPRHPQFITWVSLHLQFGQGFARLRDFRRAFLDVLDTVHAQYRAARVEADRRGITLRYSPPPVKGRLAIAPRPAATIEHRQAPTEWRLEDAEPSAEVAAVVNERVQRLREAYRAWEESGRQGPEPDPDDVLNFSPAEHFEFMYRQLERAETVLRIKPLDDDDRKEIVENARLILAGKKPKLIPDPDRLVRRTKESARRGNLPEV
jgi:Plasmid encoded RepA protein